MGISKPYIIENGLEIQGDLTFAGILTGNGSGLTGLSGSIGASAYEVAVSNGFSGTESQWLDSLVGPAGANGLDGAPGPAGDTGPVGANGADGANGLDGAPGPAGANGLDGADGLSAYQIAVSNGFSGTESDWLNSLVGPPGIPGTPGSNGASAYEIAVSNGFVGSEQDWLLTSGGVTISDTAPSPAVNEQLWWDSSSGRLFIYYSDGSSSQWVDASPQIAGQAGAPGADGTTYTASSIVQLGSLGIGAIPSGVTGEIRASNNITAYYSSDKRLKENIKPIENALSKLDNIHGMTFDWTEEEIQRRGGVDNYFVRKSDIGVIAQEIESVLPEAVATRPDGYKAVRYELIVPLLIQAIKEQQEQIDLLKLEIRK